MTSKYAIILSFVTLLFICRPLPSTKAIANEHAYCVTFLGLEDEGVKKLLFSASQLLALQGISPTSDQGLERRAAEDVPNLVKALQSLAYFHPNIDVSIDRNQTPPLVILTVKTGPVYPFSSFRIIRSEDNCDLPTLPDLCEDELGIIVGTPALPSKIIGAEETLITLLKQKGYPLAKLVQREVIADETNKSIAVVFHIKAGPLAYFGFTDITGNKTVLPQFFSRKIAWKMGETYQPCLVSRTLNTLEASGLFSSINITHDDDILTDNLLPMHIVVREAKHRSIGFGFGYATDLGPGFNAEWEHRNIRGLGEKLSVVANVWQIKQEGYIRYIMPDFYIPRQDLIWRFDINREETKGFHESSISISAIIERHLTDYLRFSYGSMLMGLSNTNSDNNRDFNLIKLPLQLMWNRTNSLLDPTTGYTLHLKVTPSLEIISPCFAYSIHVLTTTAYHALDENQRIVLAGKATMGSIYGANKHTIPPSERFYAGSDSLLRGYRYLTVSPLRHNKPIGGRSLMVFSLEARIRIFDPFGLVTFYDAGNVYSESLPQQGKKLLQSVGIGLRYHTPVGPIRLDVAFPLNPRRNLDNPFQLYFSIGQAF